MAGETIRIRMYAVGFGDCFLLGFPGPDREHLVLIDCGVHSASLEGAKLPDVIRDIVAEATKATGHPYIDVVVATHHHLDHVHGFRFGDWDGVDVGEVWLPWTEDPDDADARRIRDTQSKRAKFLFGLAADTDKKWTAVRKISENNLGMTNAAAMTTLHEGFGGSPRRWFLPQRPGKARARRFATKALPGVAVSILGPSRDEAAIRDMDPPSDQSYLRLGAGRELAATGAPLPFERDVLDLEAFSAENPELIDLLRKNDRGRIVNAGKTDALALAVTLEQATNGTSLMLVFACGDTTMLFPGDAQWGTWDRALNDAEWKALLADVNFYKVGHHGSHNATPKRWLDKTVSAGHVLDATAVSVGPTSIQSWQDIPRKPLLAALATRSGVVVESDILRRAAIAGDAPPTDNRVTESADGLWTEIRLPVTR